MCQKALCIPSVTIDNGIVTVVSDWPVDAFCAAKIKENVDALEDEKKAVADLL